MTTLVEVGALGVMKWGAACLLSVAVGTLVAGALAQGRYPGRQALQRYRAWLDHTIRRCFLSLDPRHVLLSQAAALIAGALGALALGDPQVLLGAGMLAALPLLYLARIRHQRAAAIDAQADGFAVALANSLKTTPNIGAALAAVLPVTRAPLRQEIGLILAELRVGSSVEQSLLAASARIGSSSLDAAISALLIGRQVGGNVPQVLETTAATLREMHRLSGVVRTKTAEGRMQLWMLGAFPFGFCLAFQWVSPGYFEPLYATFVGRLVALAAVGLWLSAVLAARAIMAVDL